MAEYEANSNGMGIPPGAINCFLHESTEEFHKKYGKLPDVDFNAWYGNYVCNILRYKIAQGYLDGTFKPNNQINFVEATKIIVRAGIGALDEWNEFAVNDISEDTDVWFRPFVKYLEERKAIPTSIASFDQKITRGEMAEIIYRLLVPAENDSRTYDELAGIIDSSTRSPSELIDALNRTDWTDQILLDTLCHAAKRPDVIAITGGTHPPCEFMQANKWHEWKDRYWPGQ